MRNDVKWAPFNSVINSNEAVRELLKERGKIKKPTLSEEQIEYLERKIIDRYQSQLIASFKYFSNGQIIELSGLITKIDPINKKVIIDNHISLYFTNIMDICEKNT